MGSHKYVGFFFPVCFVWGLGFVGFLGVGLVFGWFFSLLVLLRINSSTVTCIESNSKAPIGVLSTTGNERHFEQAGTGVFVT